MGSVILETIVPGLGAIVSLLMYGAPLSAVLRASANKTLGVRGIMFVLHMTSSPSCPSAFRSCDLII